MVFDKRQWIQWIQLFVKARLFDLSIHFGAALLSWHVQYHDLLHDDVIKWKHFPRCWPFVRGIHRSPVISPHKGQWRGALMFPLICVWINGWVNNREAGDFRRYHAHYDVTVMLINFSHDHHVFCKTWNMSSLWHVPYFTIICFTWQWKLCNVF